MGIRGSVSGPEVEGFRRVNASVKDSTAPFAAVVNYNKY